ncbi:hypothetical protein GGG16DRAFT_108167 [Schizophyllum commune]
MSSNPTLGEHIVFVLNSARAAYAAWASRERRGPPTLATSPNPGPVTLTASEYTQQLSELREIMRAEEARLQRHRASVADGVATLLHRAGISTLAPKDKEEVLVALLLLMTMTCQQLEWLRMQALEIEDTERSRSSEMDTQADRMLASMSRSSTAEDMAQATAPQAANEATLSPFGVLIQRFCELLDAVDLPRHALDGLERLIEMDKAGHTAPGGALEHTTKKELSPESQLELTEIVKWAFPIEDMKALILDSQSGVGEYGECGRCIADIQGVKGYLE